MFLNIFKFYIFKLFLLRIIVNGLLYIFILIIFLYLVYRLIKCINLNVMIWKLMYFLFIVSYCDLSEKKIIFNVYLDKIVFVVK